MGSLTPVEVILILAIMAVPIALLIWLGGRTKRASTPIRGNGSASSIHRFVNWVVDTVAILFIWALVLFLVLVAVSFSTRWSEEELMVVAITELLLVFWGYYILAEYRFQRTLGKLLTGTKVVAVNGERPTLKRIILRTLSRSIPFEYFSYLISADGLHDRLSRTRVVRVQPMP